MIKKIKRIYKIMTAKTPTKIKIKMQKKQTIKIKNRINLFKKKPTILKVINRYKN